MTREVSPPAKVWVSSYEFPLEFLHPEDERLEEADGLTDVGEETRAIYIAGHLDDRKMLEIVWHEITHALNWAHDIDDGVKEERLARAHGLAWSQFFLDNPKFVRWYTHVVNRIRKERKG